MVEIAMACKKIGLICCEDTEKWGREEGCARLMIERLAMLAGLDMDEFAPFYAVTGELPSLEDLEKYSGFVISGSTHSVNEESDWIRRLEEFVRNCSKNYENVKKVGDGNLDAPKVVGLCFGHQLLSKAFGGAVGRNPSKKFVIGVENIQPTNSFLQKPFFANVFENGLASFNILQTHGESILKLPSSAEVLATSKSCDYEIIQFGNVALGIQGHPEMTIELITDKIIPSLKARNVMSLEEEQATLESFKTKTSGKEVVDALLAFIGRS